MLERAKALKLALTDFVYEAEGDLAIALEASVADQLSRSQSKDAKQRDMAVDIFLTRGQVGTKTPLELFVESELELDNSDRALVLQWSRSFNGLFSIQQILPDGFKLMNWLTTQTYRVKTDAATQEAMARLKVGEILLTRLAPLTDADWMVFSPWVQLGSLGKPKLAVAIGNFKQNYKFDLYGDAPDLLEEAWKSVERYYQDFLDFFGRDELTLSGYELGKKINEFQDFLSKRRMDEAGIDQTKSMAELAKEAGVTDEELNEMAESMGMDAETAAKMMHTKAAAKMMTPQVELPPELKKAEQVTILAHPRWGQIVLPTYTQFINLLQSENWQAVKNADALIRKYLDDAEITSYVWHHIAEQYPAALEKLLQEFLQRPDFKLTRDLDPLLQQHHKLLDPELPEIASVPIHLHHLFQAALAEVSKTKSKEKTAQKGVKGFARS